MIRVIFALVILGVAFFLIRLFLALLASRGCDNCEGLGYWEGIRGDKNFCKSCNGTGQKK